MRYLWICILLLCACEAPTAPELESDDAVFFAHGEAPEPPKKLKARKFDNSNVEISWGSISRFADQIQIKKEQFETNVNNHPCNLMLTELILIDASNATFNDSLDFSQGHFVRYTFSSVYAGTVSIKQSQIDVIFPKGSR